MPCRRRFDQGAHRIRHVVPPTAPRDLRAQYAVRDLPGQPGQIHLVEGLHELRAAHHVQHAAGLRRAGHHLVGAQSAQRLTMLGGVAGGGDHVCAAESGELDGVAADASRGAGHEDPPPQDGPDPVERAQRGAGRDRDGADRARLRVLGHHADPVGTYGAELA
ncbi:hypothetical protein ACQEVF_23325 [Nonomuraea polychroma]|uniref:hypothetical protein n=1 Tax=Nonomuraea polychroma TaxID=46176 RepID=UPI003D8B8F2A